MYSIKFSNLNLALGNIRKPLLNQLLVRVGYNDLNESLGVNRGNVVNNFSLEIPLVQRLYIKGNENAINALLRLFHDKSQVAPVDSFEINRTLFSLPKFISVAQRKRDCTVASLVETTLRAAPDYIGKPRKDLISILAISSLCDKCYHPVDKLGFSELVLLGMATLIYSKSHIALIDQRQLSSTTSNLECLGRMLKIEYCDRNLIMIGDSQPVNWFEAEKEVFVF